MFDIFNSQFTLHWSSTHKQMFSQTISIELEIDSWFVSPYKMYWSIELNAKSSVMNWLITEQWQILRIEGGHWHTFFVRLFKEIDYSVK